MKIMLLGASGQLGREWHHFLQAADVTLFSYDSGRLDITRPDDVAGEIGKRQPDAVINCAAYTAVDRAEKEREKARRVNAGAAGTLAKVCREAGCRLVHYSTDYVFPGRKEDRVENPEGYAEDYPAEPVNWYGQTKWEGEQAIRRSGAGHLIIRTSWLCGAFGSNFVKTMLKAGSARDRLKIVDDQWGSPSFAENIVKNTFALLRADEKGTFHITSHGLITWYELAKGIFDIKNIGTEPEAVTSEEYGGEAKRPFFSKLNTGKIRTVSGVELQDWQEGLRRLLNRLE